MTHTTQLHTTTISFPEIKLKQRDAHKLRGYFGNLFREHSPLLHNHLEGEQDAFNYEYPKVQYKVVNEVPMLVGLGEGARLLTELFLKINELILDDRAYPIYAKNIESKIMEVGLTEHLHFYRFEALWLALNQPNYNLYRTYDDARKADQLRGIATRNIMAFLAACDLPITKDQRIMVALNDLKAGETNFKNTKMMGFKGQLVSNVLLPDFVGLGKSVARGFGTLVKTNG
jgi:hypothetical protein